MESVAVQRLHNARAGSGSGRSAEEAGSSPVDPATPPRGALADGQGEGSDARRRSWNGVMLGLVLGLVVYLQVTDGVGGLRGHMRGHMRGAPARPLGGHPQPQVAGDHRAQQDRLMQEQQSNSESSEMMTLRRHSGSQIYVPCGVKFKPPKNKPDMMAHAEFFDNYTDVSQEEADRYRIKTIAGRGSYGLVAEATDTRTGETVAIKKMFDVFMRRSDALRNLRELKLLRMMKSSEDIVEIKHILRPQYEHSYTTIFFVMEKMEESLKAVVRLAKYLPPETQQVMLFQMLRGLHYMHTANVYHRDIKPSNILVNKDCKVKLCDFSLARPVYSTEEEIPTEWTGYVATRWYRPPEMCLTKYTRWTQSMDVWGIGCVFLEAVLGRPVFPGKTANEQIQLITDVLGTPAPEVLAKYPPKVQELIQAKPAKPAQDLTKLYPEADEDAVRLAAAMLDLDPDQRPTPAQVLSDPIFDDLWQGSDSARSPSVASDHDFSFSDHRRSLTFDQLRQLIYREVMHYHPDRARKWRPSIPSDPNSSATATPRQVKVAVRRSQLPVRVSLTEQRRVSRR